MTDLRIQIVNYKTKPYLIDCIASMRKELERADFSYSFAILDNASGDDLSDIPKTFPWLNDIEIIQGTKNLGFGAGHNLLAKRGDVKYLLILNPDIQFVEKDTVGRLLQTIKKTHSQIVGPRLVTKDGFTQAWDHGGWHATAYWLGTLLGSRSMDATTGDRRALWISGAFLLTEKSVFDLIGGFDEEYFLHYEDLDLCDRIRDAGGKILYISSVKVTHIAGVVTNVTKWRWSSIRTLRRKRFHRLLSMKMKIV